jgi:hypothetical protein
MKLICNTSLMILLVFIGSTNAQVRVGVFGGVNLTDFNGDNPPNGTFNFDYGYDIGLTTDYYFLDDIALNIQPKYSSQSTVLQYDVRYQYDKYDSISVNSDYFEIPVNVKVIANNKIAYVTAGISLAIPLSAIAKNNRNGREEDIVEKYEPYILLANFGVGIQFSIGQPMLFVELRYSQSLTNLTKLEIQEVEINHKLKSNVMQLNTGILFSL